MSDTDARIANRFIPRRLFANRLASGFAELSAHFILNPEDGSRIGSIEWEIRSEPGDVVLRSTTPVPDQGEGTGKAVPIAAILPPSWERGTLSVRVEPEGHYQIPIERFAHQTAFILPLSGQALTAVGHRIGEAHRSALQIPSQQFGWDFLGLGDEGLGIVHLPTDRPLRASDFPGFGMDVIAPAEGQVHDVRDGQEEGVEIGRLPQDLAYYQQDLTRALGNYAILEHAEGIWSVLGHLRKGSLRVHVGQDVDAGDVLGALGNSGFTSGPHLHFHLMDGPDILEASPLPVVLTLEDGVFAPQAGDIISNAMG